MSRRPAPTALKLIRGNPGHRPINTQEPVAPPEIPDPPAFLSPAALAEWNRNAPLFRDSGLLSRLDRDCLASYCQALSRLYEAEAKLKELGLTYTTPTGFERPSPWLKIANEATNTILRIACEFGLTPAARSRVKADDAHFQDDFDRYLASGPRAACERD